MGETMNKTTIILIAITLVGGMLFSADYSSATAISITDGRGANDYILGASGELPYRLGADNNDDSILYLWDEVQNYTLTEDLFINRVADPSASYIGQSGRNYFIRAGTIISSHYVQWDPPRSRRVRATLNFDSDVFGLITSGDYLAASDFLGLPGIDYNDYFLRGLERRDRVSFNDGSIDIRWRANRPGDWTRLITAESPGGNPAPVPEPATVLLLGAGLAGMAVGRNRKNRAKKR